MTVIKLDAKIRKAVARALEDYADDMFEQRAGTWIGIVEFTHVERTEPGDRETAEDSVKIGIAGLEIAPDRSESDVLRQQMRELYRRRTNTGTFDEVEATVNGVPLSDVLRTGSGVLTGATTDE